MSQAILITLILVILAFAFSVLLVFFVPFSVKRLKIRWLPLLIIFLIILFFTGWFYWFQYRPGNIRTECVRNSLKSAKETENREWSQINNYYRVCLAGHGLKAEDLVK